MPRFKPGDIVKNKQTEELYCLILKYVRNHLDMEVYEAYIFDMNVIDKSGHISPNFKISCYISDFEKD